LRSSLATYQATTALVADAIPATIEAQKATLSARLEQF
jgi:hypothetical protein